MTRAGETDRIFERRDGSNAAADFYPVVKDEDNGPE